MNKFLLIAIMILTIPAFAHESESENENPSPADLVEVKSFKLPNKKGTVHVVVRKDGHAMGMPYMIELRPHCGSGSKDWKKIQLVDVESACDYEKGSVALDENKQEVTFRIRDVDADRFNEESMTDAANASLACVSKFKSASLSVKEICP